ncbi:MAG: bifunctional alpha/beta hydrolase/OsmC family protein [Desulfobulbia bacterium]
MDIASSFKLTFPGSQDSQLSARLDIPAGSVKAYALFAHCFTCSKDFLASSRIAGELTKNGIAVLRIDFTGLGSSKGEFASTNFSSNVGDLLNAAEYLRQNYQAPGILIGHSLGGSAVIAAAAGVPEARAVVTIGSPADVEHVTENFGASKEEIERKGVAEVTLGGRQFTIKKQFLEDVRSQNLLDKVANLKKALLIFHAPQDLTVGIENASQLYNAAKHPKSFISLDDADHLITSPKDAAYISQVLSAWVSKYIEESPPSDSEDFDSSILGLTQVKESGEGKFQQLVVSGKHRMFADEPIEYGGSDTGPSPYDYLNIALGACTSMTIRMYADRKGIQLDHVSVDVNHEKVHAKDCEDCGENHEGRVDRFMRKVKLTGKFDDESLQKLIAIADKCPVHMTLEKSSVIATDFEKNTVTK